MADAIEYKLDLDVDGKKAIEQVLSKIGELEKKLGSDASKGAQNLKKELAAIHRTVLNLDLSKLDSKDALNTITERINKIGKGTEKISNKVSPVKSSFSGLATITKAIKGDMRGFMSSIQDAVESTKSWGAAVEKVGIAKMAGAMAFAVEGINQAVSGFNRMMDVIRNERKGKRDGDIELNRAIAKQSSISLAEKESKIDREIRTQGIESAKKSAQRENDSALKISSIDQELQFGLAGSTNERERDRLRREAEWKKKEVSMQKEMADAEQAIQDAIFRKNKAKEKNAIVNANVKRLNDAMGNLDSIKSGVEKRIEKRTDGKGKTFIRELWKNLGGSHIEDMVGTEGLSQLQDRLANASDAKAEMQAIIKELIDKQREGVIDQKQADLDVQNAKLNKSNISMSQSEQRGENEESKRTAERRIAMEDEQLKFEMSEKERQNNEADIEAKNKYLDGLSTFAERKAMLQEEIYRNDSQIAEQESKLASIANSRDIATMNSWNEMDQREARRAIERIQQLKDKRREQTTSMQDMERQGDTERESSKRRIEMERRNREDADIEALNNWQQKVGGPMASLGVAQQNYERWNKKLADAQGLELNFKNEMMKKYGLGPNVNLQGAEAQAKMTQAERDRYSNLHGDVVDFEGRARTAKYDKMGAEYDRQNRAAEFRANAMQQGNRLTAMGLGGDVSADFAKSTAGNTKELVSLTKEMLKTFSGGGKGKRLEESANRWSM